MQETVKYVPHDIFLAYCNLSNLFRPTLIQERCTCGFQLFPVRLKTLRPIVIFDFKT